MRFIEAASKNIPEIKKAASQRHRTRRELSFPLLRMFLAALTAEKRGLTLLGCTDDFNYSLMVEITSTAKSFG
jgi:hypothetical protein